ncbi:MAG: hypothetical protein UY74_C0006G0026 [Candidatus Kaiserbacteria bacterium GW2011_GWC2_52_8b]|uniref:Uncharacterized protein n=2 Tax=Candidatus Kaiseribacteriota TaxID=1752734 RepID=A0A0G1ZU36_9BACT|nr:MAG: hypothetical protein UY67_C0010G0009 [Candidatus Kaiserbacteria bacterium GW2011_GWA2_52_12]KKW31827.1 MAG: hypothetical protein UY74_C0006G0026 [Candidatus Kaiserbacteria bacterium GW2011_GWC2_52_8b]
MPHVFAAAGVYCSITSAGIGHIMLTIFPRTAAITNDSDDKKNGFFIAKLINPNEVIILLVRQKTRKGWGLHKKSAARRGLAADLEKGFLEKRFLTPLFAAGGVITGTAHDIRPEMVRIEIPAPYETNDNSNNAQPHKSPQRVDKPSGRVVTAIAVAAFLIHHDDSSAENSTSR